MTKTVEAIDSYRYAACSLRGIARRGGRTGATTKAIEFHEQQQAHAVQALLAAGRRVLVGELVEEEQLAERLMGIAATERPELRERLNNVRRCIRAARQAAA